MINIKDLFPDPDKGVKSDMVTKGITKLRRHIESAKDRSSESETCYGQRLLRESIPLIAKGIVEWQQQQEKSPVPSAAFAVTKDIPRKVLAYIALKSVLDSLSQHRSLSSAAIRIGALVEDEARFRMFASHPDWEAILRGASKRPNYSKRRYYLIHSMKGEAAKGQAELWDSWALRTKLHVGTVLITLIRDYTGLIEYVMVNKQNGKYKATRYISPTKATKEWIEGMIKHNELLTPFWMPLTAFPKQWDNKWSGAYHEDMGLPPVPLMKTRNKAILRKSEEPMTEVMSSLNHLQNTAWKINPFVHQALVSVWERNIQIGDLPAQEDEELPPFPVESEDSYEIRDWKRTASGIYQHNASTKSRRILVLNTLGLAAKFSRKKRLYLPHQCDFRGRAYTMPAYLSHMGPDFAKGLMTFADGVPCKSEEDRKWLMIHGANCYGIKGTFDQRLSWVENNSSKIIDTGRHPMTMLDFWEEADEPFQFLAFCEEFRRMVNEGPDFITHLPCQMDASNNGLQILGMLMRDRSSCVATNVADTPQPNDIYQIVADRATEFLIQDSGNAFARAWLKFGISRDCTKRPTMTQPYGSTPHSCRSYVNDWYLKAVRSGKVEDPFDADSRFKATAYLSGKVWEAINQVVGKPRQAMAWMQKSAKLLSEHNIPIRWVTPSGFPVYQGYEKLDEKSIRTKVGDKIFRVNFREDSGVLSSKRQAQGISPNFVHSLDASILHKTVNKCAEAGIKSYSMVHDSFGTHSPNCPELANFLRSTVHDIFLLDHLSLLKQTLEESSKLSLPSLPEYGNFSIEEVLTSKYIYA